MQTQDRPAQPLIIGVTSHRNLVPEETEALRTLVRSFLARLQHDYPRLPLTVVSALAAGGDQLVAEEALALGARLVAPLPLPLAAYVQDFDDLGVRARFDALCRRATVIEAPVRDEPPADGAPAPERGRDWHYAQTGIYIASHCHLLLAIWDGKPATLPGGTAEVVDYYLTGRKPALVERRRGARGENLIDDNNQRLAWHIACSRAQADGVPQAPLRPLQSSWRTGEQEWPGDAPMPAPFRAMFERIVALDEDSARHAQDIGRAARTVSRGQADDPLRRSPIERAFAAADWLALHYRRRVLVTMRTMYTLAALMGFAFVLYDNLDQQGMIFVFLSLFAVGVTLDRVATRREWHRRYLDYRALAEGLRVQAYWRRAGLSMTGDAEFAHDNFLQKQDVDLGWIRNVMRAAALQAAADGTREADLHAVIEEWVGASGRGGQLRYYEQRLAERTRHHRLTEAVGGFTLWAGIAVSAFLAAFVFRLRPEVQGALVALMAVLSITAAVREAYAWRKADRELIKQYRFMRRIFANARSALDRTTDPIEQREILRALGEAALAEHAEWTLMHRERPLERARM